ncbi:MAG TPA: alpha/beta fold hydrolase, partial [Longimicrobiaceae bacterium]|nr:alpha/beta fold hydrolase [Longimicrobiaceae bacterium]
AISRSSLSAALLLLSRTPALAQQPLEPGTWRGAYEVGDQFRPVILTVPASGDARMQAAMIDTTSFVVALGSEQGATVINWMRGQQPIRLTGTPAGGIVRGEAMAGDARGTFVLRRVADVPLERLKAHVGEYRLGDGSLLSISGGSSPYEGLSFFHFRTGRTGKLFALSEDRYVAGPRRFDVDPVELTVEFEGADRAVVRYPDGRVETGRRMEMRREREVTITSGAVRLAGTLTLPAGRGPFPAVVLLHGSDPHLRFRGTIVSFFVSQGLAVLTWDKRGNGGSTGTLETSTIDTFAVDAEAAVAFLRRQPEIDAARVGVWGVSQGGWPAARVAEWDSALAFVIIHAGSGLTPARQGEDEMRSMIQERGGSEDDMRDGLAYLRAFEDLVRTGQGRAALDSTYQALRARGFRFAWSPALAETPRSRLQRGIMDFDPLPSWAKSRVPLLAFFGQNDPLVPPETNLEPMRQARARSGAKTEFYVIPGVNHRFELTPRRRTNSDFALASREAPVYYETMARWLRETLGRN